MREKKEKKRWGLIAFLVMIMVGTSFTAYYGFQSQDQVSEYNGIKFRYRSSGSIWIAKISGREAAFSSLPQDAAGINASQDLPSLVQGKFEIDSTSEANSTFKETIALAQHQMGLTLQAYNIFLRKGFTSNNTFNAPVITCSSSPKNVPVIHFVKSNSTGITVKENCIEAAAISAADIIKAKDRLLYIILGVMK